MNELNILFCRIAELLDISYLDLVRKKRDRKTTKYRRTAIAIAYELNFDNNLIINQFNVNVCLPRKSYVSIMNLERFYEAEFNEYKRIRDICLKEFGVKEVVSMIAFHKIVCPKLKK